MFAILAEYQEHYPVKVNFVRDTPYLSVFSPNAGKYGPEKSPYLDIFHAVQTAESR